MNVYNNEINTIASCKLSCSQLLGKLSDLYVTSVTRLCMRTLCVPHNRVGTESMSVSVIYIICTKQKMGHVSRNGGIVHDT